MEVLAGATLHSPSTLQAPMACAPHSPTQAGDWDCPRLVCPHSHTQPIGQSCSSLVLSAAQSNTSRVNMGDFHIPKPTSKGTSLEYLALRAGGGCVSGFHGTEKNQRVLGRLLPPGYCKDSRLKHSPSLPITTLQDWER